MVNNTYIIYVHRKNTYICVCVCVCLLNRCYSLTNATETIVFRERHMSIGRALDLHVHGVKKGRQ